jgi:hypothetical protein
MFARAVIPAAAFGVGLIFIPNSPRWLVSRSHADQARAVLNRIRPTDQVESELSDIQHSAAQQKGHWSEMFSPLLRPAMIVLSHRSCGDQAVDKMCLHSLIAVQSVQLDRTLLISTPALPTAKAT